MCLLPVLAMMPLGLGLNVARYEQTYGLRSILLARSAPSQFLVFEELEDVLTTNRRALLHEVDQTMDVVFVVCCYR